MRCNWWRWLWGIIPLLVLSWVAIEAEHARLENDLTERGKAALSAKGFDWAIAEFKGRDAVLSGRAPQEGEPAKAAAALAETWGVRIVDNRAGLLDKAEKYIWIASRRNNRIRLSGFAPSISARQAILGVTKATFPGYEVVDRTTLARGVPSTDVWLAGVSFALKQLTGVKRGDARLEDLDLALSGEADDVAAYRAIKSALAGGAPKGIKVIRDNVTAPVVSPYAWSARVAEGRLVLAGHVPSEEVRAQFLAAAKMGLPGMAVVDQMEPGEGPPQGWTGMVVAALRDLGRLEGASVEMKDAAFTVAGVASDAVTAEAVRTNLRAALPATMRLTDQIHVKELPLPPPLPSMPEAALPAAPAEPGPANQGSANPRPLDAAPVKTGSAPVQPAVTASTEPQAAGPTQVSQSPAAPETVIKAKACEDQLAALAAAGQIHFAYASAELDSVSFPTLDKLAEAAKSCPGMTIEVGGHASPEGIAEMNQQLSLKRAQSVVTYLVRAGVDATQLRPVGHGASQPIAPNTSSENMAKNRRIEFTVRPK